MISGVINVGPDGPPHILLSPRGAISRGRYEGLAAAAVPITHRGNRDIDPPFDDRSTGSGARG